VIPYHGWQGGSGVSEFLKAARSSLAKLNVCVHQHHEPLVTKWDLPALTSLHTNIEVGLCAPQLESMTCSDDAATSFLRFAAEDADARSPNRLASPN
jgi:hypothetical protein